MIYLH